MTVGCRTGLRTDICGRVAAGPLRDGFHPSALLMQICEMVRWDPHILVDWACDPRCAFLPTLLRLLRSIATDPADFHRMIRRSAAADTDCDGGAAEGDLAPQFFAAAQCISCIHGMCALLEDPSLWPPFNVLPLLRCIRGAVDAFDRFIDDRGPP